MVYREAHLEHPSPQTTKEEIDFVELAVVADTQYAIEEASYWKNGKGSVHFGGLALGSEALKWDRGSDRQQDPVYQKENFQSEGVGLSRIFRETESVFECC